ncbi:hypothetical protein [Arundinibacter roseus]|uniref:hypothetical protein n=1 Tax=Arundinibacter roseus TaxID=2070510 RepID=UPI0014051A1A|nr:hypothetical protein [Arundinibacter roseus]
MPQASQFEVDRQHQLHQIMPFFCFGDSLLGSDILRPKCFFIYLAANGFTTNKFSILAKSLTLFVTNVR